MGRVKLSLAAGVEVEFTDRERALKQAVGWGLRGH